MYDMYPDAWVANDGRRPTAAEEKPRRRIRKEHVGVPVTLGAPTSSANLSDGA